MQTTKIPGDVRVTAYQKAARLYCEMAGENPDDDVPTPHPVVAGVAIIKPYWYTVAERMYDLALLIRAMRKADPPETPQAANDPSNNGSGKKAA